MQLAHSLETTLQLLNRPLMDNTLLVIDNTNPNAGLLRLIQHDILIPGDAIQDKIIRRRHVMPMIDDRKLERNVLVHDLTHHLCLFQQRRML